MIKIVNEVDFSGFENDDFGINWENEEWSEVARKILLWCEGDCDECKRIDYNTIQIRHYDYIVTIEFNPDETITVDYAYFGDKEEDDYTETYNFDSIK